MTKLVSKQPSCRSGRCYMSCFCASAGYSVQCYNVIVELNRGSLLVVSTCKQVNYCSSIQMLLLESVVILFDDRETGV